MKIKKGLKPIVKVLKQIEEIDFAKLTPKVKVIAPKKKKS